MCGLCGVLTSEHWAELGSDRRQRLFRARLLDRVLGHFGLAVSEWAGQYIVRDRTGRSIVTLDLAGVWVAAEDLLGRPLDPLDVGLVAGLQRAALTL